MEEKINILDLEMDCITAKSAMIRAIQFLDSDSLNTIEIMSMSALMSCRDDGAWKSLAGGADLLIPGEAELLKAADIPEKTILKETGEGTFLKLFIKYIQKNHKKIYILAESEEELEKTQEMLRRRNRGIRFSGGSVLDPQEAREENVVNDINGTETDCILSVLPAPYQEEFISRNKALLNARVWLGCGRVFRQQYDSRTLGERAKHFFLKKMFHYRVERENRDE